MANSSGRVDSANGAPPATAPFIINSADFPPLTSQPATHSESTQPDSTQVKNKSFAEAVFPPSAHRQKSQRTELQELQKFFLTDSTLASIGTTSNINGRTTLIFSDSETQSLADDFKFALIGKFSHGSPPYSQLHRLLVKSGLKGAFTVSLINTKHALISLTNESDYNRLWLRRIWILNGFPMRVFKWSPPSLRIMNRPSFLFGNIGTPLQIADSTFNQSNLANARVCVEIDLLKPLLKEIDIQICGTTIVQSIVYEHIPSYCSLCKHVGHCDADCYSTGNAPKPHPNRRHSGKKNAAVENHKLKGKALVYKVLEKKPQKNQTVTEVGECSKNAADQHRYVSESVVHNAENEVIHAENDDFLVESGTLNAENEIIHAENDDSLVETGTLTAENEISVDENNSIRVIKNVNELEDAPRSSFHEIDGNGITRKDKIDGEFTDDTCGVGPVIERAVTEIVEKNIGNMVYAENDIKGREIQLFYQPVKPVFSERRGNSLKQFKTKEVFQLMRRFGVVCHAIKYAEPDEETHLLSLHGSSL
ncbi:UNVERIFIED_CONTAM: hypothetical protein Sangu_1308400 [Sesamum angustifolium]|uniref:DUF4283 domain-containing protein n=1 Tax=Sesamum angustifolium TaxID=2727405 RepID=A0AAW2NL59_9LAMI